MIKVKNAELSAENMQPVIDAGYAVQGFILELPSLIASSLRNQGLKADFYKTYRGGDTVFMAVPINTPPEALPDYAKCYGGVKWEKILL